MYPAEVEAVLSAAPGVEDVAVFGVEDDQWGQRVCAAVVGDADEAELRRYATQRLAPYKRPKQYFRVGELPYSATGKLRRRHVPVVLGLAPSHPPGPG